MSLWPKSLHIELSHSVEHLILGLEHLLLHLHPLPDHLQGVALAMRHEVDPGVNGLQVDAHLNVPDDDRFLARVQLLKHLLGLLSCDGPKNVRRCLELPNILQMVFGIFWSSWDHPSVNDGPLKLRSLKVRVNNRTIHTYH